MIYEHKTKEELAEELRNRDLHDRIIEQSRKLFAQKVVEYIVFALIGMFALATLYFIFINVGLPTPSLP